MERRNIQFNKEGENMNNVYEVCIDELIVKRDIDNLEGIEDIFSPTVTYTTNIVAGAGGYIVAGAGAGGY